MKTKVLFFALALVVLGACTPKDTQITSWVQTQLEAISPDIHVSTEKGIVTLTGEVDHSIMGQDFTTLLEKVKGVKGVVNNLTAKEVVNFSTDEVLKQAVLSLIGSHEPYKGVKYEINGGEINLTGSIKKENLPALMEAIHGLNPKKVENNITLEK